MFRVRNLFVLFPLVLLPALGLSSCKKGEKDKAAAPQTEEKVGEAAKLAVAAQPVVVDVKLIDATLAALADATVAHASKEGEAGGLPALDGKTGIACGDDALLASSLAHVAFDASALKAGAGFRFEHVCVGWRPYVQPLTEMYWMISAGEPAGESGMMPTRRCIRVAAAKGAYSKEPIMDGPCLSMHRNAAPTAAPVPPAQP